MVGGIARTESYKGFHFDIGGHRFFTKSAVVNALWEEILGDELLKRPRLSRIYYRRRYFDYPPRLWNSLKGLGPAESVRVVSSYLRWQLAPHRTVESFEQWVTNAFGRRLFQIFFEAYTEKVWGVSCSELRAEWAAQRIRGLSLRSVIRNMLMQPRNQVKSLIGEFRYPRLGPGMLWRAVCREVERRQGEVRLNEEVKTIRRAGSRITGVVLRGPDGTREVLARAVISSMPITELMMRLDPPPPAEILCRTGRLRHRDFLTVCLIVDQARLFPDNWIYVHEPGVKVARIQNFKNWSPAMVPDPAKTSLGLEYFCQEGDALWSLPDAALVALAGRELEQIGLVAAARIIDGCVFRVAKAYPVYDSSYAADLAVVRAWCDGFDNLQTVGRNGLHRYNNQDHSMLTGFYAVRRLLFGEPHDLWRINAEQDYLEEEAAEREPLPGGAPATNPVRATAGAPVAE